MCIKTFSRGKRYTESEKEMTSVINQKNKRERYEF